MSENDLIAEYVKENYPDLLETFDFAAYKLLAHVRKTGEEFAAAISEIDFSGAKEAINKLAHYLSLANATDPQLLSCTGCKHENSTDIIEYLKFCNICKRGKNDEYEREYHEDLYEAKEGSE